MKLETKEIAIAKSAEEVYSFFSDFNNYIKILPDSISEWKADTESCSFSFDGKIRMAMKFEVKTPFSFIKIIPSGKALFDYSMSCIITPNENGCFAKISFEASLNPFMKMLAEKPLENFLRVIEGKVQQIFV